jgi:hypothetical protein
MGVANCPQLFAAALTVENVYAVKAGGMGKHGWDLEYVEAVEGIKVCVFSFFPACRQMEIALRH